MPLKIVRNDITLMDTEAIVNTAGSTLEVGDGCDVAIYTAAGYDELLSYREKNIGEVPEGEVFITPGFNLPAGFIIHAVSPLYIDGEHGEEEKLRSCYKKSLCLAQSKGIKSIAFPLIGTGAYGYPLVDGMSIAVDEINKFLLCNDMDITLVVFGTKATVLGEKIYPELEVYIDHNYVCQKREEEYGDAAFGSAVKNSSAFFADAADRARLDRKVLGRLIMPKGSMPFHDDDAKDGVAGVDDDDAKDGVADVGVDDDDAKDGAADVDIDYEEVDVDDFDIDEFDIRSEHIEDPFGVYVHYLLESRGLKPKQVQDRGWISKHVFNKINRNPDTYQPSKTTAFQLCIGFGLSLDESKDFLAKAGIAFSPAMKDDLIWRFGIENGLDIFDISDLLVKYGYPAVVGI